jgi:hypothetical protein
VIKIKITESGESGVWDTVKRNMTNPSPKGATAKCQILVAGHFVSWVMMITQIEIWRKLCRDCGA